MQIVHDLSYNNFKSTVAAEQDYERSHLYGGVWSVMHDAERRLERKREKEAAKKSQTSFGSFSRAASYMDPWLDEVTPVEDPRSDAELDEAAIRSISLLGPEMDDVLFMEETPLPDPPKKRSRRRRKTKRVVAGKGIVKGGRKR